MQDQAPKTEHTPPTASPNWEEEQRNAYAREQHAAALLAKCAGVFREVLTCHGFTHTQAYELTRLWLEQRVYGR